MNYIKTLLTQSVSNTKAKLWQLLALLTAVWIIPAFLPEVVWREFTLYIVATSIILYALLSRSLRTILRLTDHDAVLIERFFILLSFLVPLGYGLLHGFNNGFDTGLTILLGLNSLISILLIIGIIIHIKTSSKFYHGVKKEELLT